MLNRIIHDITDFLTKQFRALSILNYRVLFYCAIIYVVVAIHHFFPILYSLYTFENLTYVFCLQIVLLVLYKQEYFRKVFDHYIKQVSIYFDITNFFLVIIVFVGIFLFSIQGADISDLSGFLIILGIGYIYNSIHKNERDTLFVPEKFNRTRILFLVIINGGIYLFLRQFLVKNGLQNLVHMLLPATLIVFNVTVLYTFTDVFGWLHQRYAIMGRVSRKTLKRVKWAQTVFVSSLTVSVLFSAGYFGYGYYKNDTNKQLAISSEAPIPDNNGILTEFPTPVTETDTPVPIGGIESHTLTGALAPSVSSTGTVSQTGTLADTRTGAQPIQTPTRLTDTGSEVKTVPKKKVRDMYTFDRYIGTGNTGKDVIQLQTLLKKSGYYKGAVTGTFDTVTGDALARFLRAKTGTKNSYTQLGPKALGMLNGIIVE